MEGEYADANPLTLSECANVAEESLTKRLSVSSSQRSIHLRFHFDN